MLTWLAAVLLWVAPAGAESNGVALLPPMGFNSWYSYNVTISESLIENIADQMATNGMLAAGYQYVNLDDGWAGYRDANNVMVANTNRFPDGMKAVADYVHAKGLKFGLYTVGGTYTCASYLGSAGYEVLDADTYAGWGVDFVKYEGCDLPWWELNPNQQTMSLRMEQALLHCGRPMVFSLSIGYVENWIPNYCNLPRGTGDLNGTWTNILYHIDTVAGMPFKGRPGMYNDPDVIDLRGEFTPTEEVSIFSMWCMLAAPLITPTVNSNVLYILTNSEAIAVDQDAAGIQGTCVASNNNTQVWCKPLGGNNTGTLAVALFNRGDNATNITANWSDLGLPPGAATVRDLWAHADLGTFTNSYGASIPAHGVQMLKVVGNVVTAPPVFGAPTIQNGSLILSGWGGNQNGTYYVLTSTNPALPLYLWTVSATNQTDSNGFFIFTNGLPAGVPEMFYRLRLP
ncbi:MAG TPA: glycoside hydrolase family 27 protein [Verrucomicrobiae bacterium]|nr:glycoside hydrolase family 27 protein [Verrucomicrobiae bacterium]